MGRGCGVWVDGEGGGKVMLRGEEFKESRMIGWVGWDEGGWVGLVGGMFVGLGGFWEGVFNVEEIGWGEVGGEMGREGNKGGGGVEGKEWESVGGMGG